MTGLDLDAVEARANAATEGPWTTGAYRRVLPGLATQTGNHAADASFIRHARTDVPEMAAELRRFQPVALTTGCQLYIHDCRQVEWWNEERQGPINEQGCDACESAPYPGGWRLVYVREDGAR